MATSPAANAGNDDNTLLSEAIAEQILLLRLVASLSAEADAELFALEATLTKELLLSISNTPPATRSGQAALANAASASISASIAKIDSLTNVTAAAAMIALAKKVAHDMAPAPGAGGAAASSPTKGAVSVVEKGPLRVLDEAAVRRIVNEALIEGAPSSAWWGRQSQDLAFKFSNIARRGVAEGLTVQQMRGEVVDLMSVGRRSADALIRSSVLSASNAVREATYEANRDALRGYRFVATLDSRTSLICAAYSGAAWDMDGKPLRGTKLPFRRPPLHWNCRSVLVALTKPLPGMPEFEPSTRAAAGGPVSASITFAQWLDTKPQAYQDGLLGKGRARLWRDGKMSLQQLLDARGNPLTLEQLLDRFGS